MHGGGYLGTLWISEENRFRKVVQAFNKNKIIVFPQTVYFSNDEEGRRQLEISKEIYSSNSSLHVILRDLKSYNYFQEITFYNTFPISIQFCIVANSSFMLN